MQRRSSVADSSGDNFLVVARAWIHSTIPNQNHLARTELKSLLMGWTGETGNGQLACNAVGMIRPLGRRDRQDTIDSSRHAITAHHFNSYLLTSSSTVPTEVTSPHLPRSWSKPRFGTLQSELDPTRDLPVIALVPKFPHPAKNPERSTFSTKPEFLFSLPRRSCYHRHIANDELTPDP
ncbi:hypothetical protein BDW67DRAFT_115474 [Aspergillus spinulosporus]